MARLADAIAQHVGMNSPTCSIRTVQLSKADRADLDAALNNLAVPGTAIARGLTEIGHKIAPGTVRRHRKGECGCPR